MAKIKSLAKIGQKFSTVTALAADEYVDGVQTSTVSWAAATKAAEKAYEGGVQKAIQQKRFGKGVSLAGDAKYKKGVAEHGGTRYAAGVSTAGPAFEKGFAPFHKVIESTVLPPRFAKRDPRNLARVAAMAKALGDAKEAQGAG